MNAPLNIELIEPDMPLTLQTRAALALNSTKTERDLRILATKNADIVAVIDKPGRMQAHSAAMELRSARTTIAKVSKDAREDAKAFQSAIIEEERRLIALVEPEEVRLIGLRDAWDEEQARIKAEAEAKERARVTAIHERIASIRGFLTLAAQCRTSERILSLVVKIEEIQREGWDDFAEFSDEAKSVAASVHADLVKIHSEKMAQEVAAANLRAEQEAQAEKLAAERAEQAKAAAELKAQRDAFEAEQAAFKAQQAAAKALIDAAERQAQEERDRAEYAAAVNATPAPFKTLDEQLESAETAAEVKTAVTQFEKTYAYCVADWNPTDMQILDALCQHFNKSESRVLERLAKGFDFVALAEECGLLV